MAADCTKLNQYLFRRVPDWDKELAKDRFPFSYIYTSFYEQKTWPSFTGTTHTWDRVHVTRPNDNGCWTAMTADDASACGTNSCQPSRKYTGWGSSRNTYTKYHQDYQSPVFCLDTLRHVEEAKAQLAAIVEGHKELPESIVSDFLRFNTMRQSDYLHIAGSAGTTVAVSEAIFTNGCTRINLGGAGNLPTSKLTMNYLDNHVENLQYNGYFKKQFLPQGKFSVTTDITTQRELANKNPEAARWYTAADFTKGGKFYEFGVMNGARHPMTPNEKGKL